MEWFTPFEFALGYYYTHPGKFYSHILKNVLSVISQYGVEEPVIVATQKNQTSFPSIIKKLLLTQTPFNSLCGSFSQTETSILSLDLFLYEISRRQHSPVTTTISGPQPQECRMLPVPQYCLWIWESPWRPLHRIVRGFKIITAQQKQTFKDNEMDPPSFVLQMRLQKYKYICCFTCNICILQRAQSKCTWRWSLGHPAHQIKHLD